MRSVLFTSLILLFALPTQTQNHDDIARTDRPGQCPPEGADAGGVGKVFLVFVHDQRQVFSPAVAQTSINVGVAYAFFGETTAAA